MQLLDFKSRPRKLFGLCYRYARSVVLVSITRQEPNENAFLYWYERSRQANPSQCVDVNEHASREMG